MNILITGRPGTGKTTLIKELIQNLGKKASGFYTEEIRKEEKRTGFRIKTLDGKEGILAKVSIESPYEVGKYRVNLENFEKVALSTLGPALKKSRIIIIDEIGPMELFSKKFRTLVLEAFDSPNPVIATIKLKGSKFIDSLKSRPDVVVYNLNNSNQKKILQKIKDQITKEEP